tara:strand:+ start:897 stop:2429 length:1533 start_codon:yes stop_codon:yes gene_type:complete
MYEYRKFNTLWFVCAHRAEKGRSWRMAEPAMAEPAAVIDEDLCKYAREGSSLVLSCKNISKISNLAGYQQLLTLKLDNNRIERIENLGCLTQLEWLDLSFNSISQITGLETLRHLSHLSLFSNRITQLQGLDSLTKLQVLSLGNNLISSADSVLHLRRFAHLQAANFGGNPFAEEAEYRSYVLTHLKHLKYLDNRIVDEHTMAMREESEAREINLKEIEAETEAAGAVTEHPDELCKVNTNLVKLLQEELLQKGQVVMAAPMQSFSEQMNEAVADFISLLVGQSQLRQEQCLEFTRALQEAKVEDANEAKVEITSYEQKHAALEAMPGAMGSDVAQLQQTARNLETANNELYDTLMEHEMACVERYANSINAFECSFEMLSKKSQSAIQEFFRHLEELEITYTENSQAGGVELIERKANIHGLTEAAPLFVGDTEVLMSMLGEMHADRVAKLKASEDQLMQAEKAALRTIISATRAEEYTRNRTRIVEIYTHVRCNSDELEKIKMTMTNP